MMSDLCEMAREGKLQPPPCVEHALQDYKNALSRGMKPFVGSKQLLVMKWHSELHGCLSFLQWMMFSWLILVSMSVAYFHSQY